MTEDASLAIHIRGCPSAETVLVLLLFQLESLQEVEISLLLNDLIEVCIHSLPYPYELLDLVSCVYSFIDSVESASLLLLGRLRWLLMIT